jgi:hypothetical protein
VKAEEGVRSGVAMVVVVVATGETRPIIEGAGMDLLQTGSIQWMTEGDLGMTVT